MTIASPAAGAVVIGTASVAVNASDNVGVASVRLSVDGIAVATSTTAPYALQWTTTTASAGLHVLTVTAFDGAGNHAADSVNVTVADQFAPSALITSPTSGARDTSTKTISVSASDNVGVTAVTLRINGQFYATDQTAPYTFSVPATALLFGSNTVEARAWDAANNYGSSRFCYSAESCVNNLGG